MSKRAAETYMTDQNWDKEQPEEEVKDSLLLLIASLDTIECYGYGNYC